MSELEHYNPRQQLQPLPRSNRLSRVEQRRHGRAVMQMEHHADLKALQSDLAAEVGRAKVQAVATVSNAAMTAQTLISSRERMLVEAEPGAINGIAYLGQRATLALGALVDDVLDQVTR